jgi:hypothetical protein
VWDGRFEIEAGRPVQVRALSGRMAGLPPADRAALSQVHASARPALPQIVDAAGEAVADVRVRPLALTRLRAACGLIGAETA